MANILSMGLRVRFKTLMDCGLWAAAGKTLLLSRATAARWGKKVRDGAPLEPLPSGCSRVAANWSRLFPSSWN